jgi:hypothetical protein
MILLIVYHKAWFPYGRNCRKGVVTVVRVVFTTKWKHEEKSCCDTLATVHDSNNSVVETKTCRDGYVFMETEKRQRGNSFATIRGEGAKIPFGGPCLSF